MAILPEGRPKYFYIIILFLVYKAPMKDIRMNSARYLQVISLSLSLSQGPTWLRGKVF